ncbi:tetratricopeptide repeat protein [Xanthomonas campestris pv. raphani]|uniref:tetratricopeptide repeat protein n=1 Tax=Xanthomonas campestris TaxID=339 RepID=UPI002B233F14|nr:tetratricopeptide repeat protein [Xanthomonas campestris]MEA9745962.1 tetratricopeptide repeat protein [Xanthomonas campestris pv. raphani]MEA9846461.1 tetratricopeptide repeat protein [Xanthomonas campestris pv. raphani]MEA9928283.1 tetratricopeptide repeat protein [Xanthomonas campestris pv. raphani]
MSPLLLLSLVLQAACCVHVVRSGRPLYWIFLLLAFSLLAVLVYVFVAVIPDLRNDPSARRSLKRVRSKLDPQREQRDASRRLDVADTPENRRQLAETLLAQGDYAQAADHFQGALRGLYRDDPHLMLGLAKAQFGLGQPAQTRQTLDALIAANPTFRSHDGHLLYARAVEDSGDIDAALHEYETLAQGYPGEEARVRYAQLLQRTARTAQAKAMYEQVLRHAGASPKHYQREQRGWVELARKGLSALGTTA